jgi:hypothetical protein
MNIELITPALIIIGLNLLGLIRSTINHGQKKEGVYNAYSHLCLFFLVMALYYWAGVFGTLVWISECVRTPR